MIRAAGLAALLVLSQASDGSGQPTLFVSGGATLPVGRFGDVAEPGTMGYGGVMLDIGDSDVVVGAEGLYGRNGHAAAGDRSDIYGLGAFLRFAVAEVARATVFVTGGVGWLRHSRKSEQFPGLEASESGAVADVGAGISVPLGRTFPFLIASYTRGLGRLNTPAFPTELLAVRVGVAVPLRD